MFTRRAIEPLLVLPSEARFRGACDPRGSAPTESDDYYLTPAAHWHSVPKLFPMDPAPAPAKKKNHPAIGWVFTAKFQGDMQMDDVDDIEAEAMHLYGLLLEHCTIFAFQLETAPTTGYQHFQGYMELINKKRLGWIKTHIYEFEFLDKRKGTPLQAWTYATKEETRQAGPWTFGKPTEATSGAQKSTEQFVRDVAAGLTDKQLWECHPRQYAMFTRVIDRIRGFTRPTRTVPLEVYLFYGPPGTGKTDFAKAQAAELNIPYYETPLGKDFWLTPDAWNKQYVIIEEFKANIQLKDLLRLLDKHPVEAPIKGGFAWWCPQFVVLTTNVNPWDWYHYNDRDFEREALFRRFSGVYLFQKNADGVPRPSSVTFDDLRPAVPFMQQMANRRMQASNTLLSGNVFPSRVNLSGPGYY